MQHTDLCESMRVWVRPRPRRGGSIDCRGGRHIHEQLGDLRGESVAPMGREREMRTDVEGC